MVNFEHSYTQQNPDWDMIYIAAYAMNVQETLTAHINTSRGNPIEYLIDWYGEEMWTNASDISTSISLAGGIQDRNSTVNITDDGNLKNICFLFDVAS